MSGSAAVAGFELHRLSDDLVYRFDRASDAQGRSGFRRRDLDLWILWREGLGWIAGSFDDAAVLGRPWDVPPQAQSAEAPPEGIWVSRKAAKSYVYQLVHL